MVTMTGMNRMRRVMRGIVAVLAGTAMALGLAACGSDPTAGTSPRDVPPYTPKPHRTITVGSANFAESQILGDIYAQALSANHIKAATRPDIGSREIYIRSLNDGSIDLIPDYSGNLLQYFNPKATQASSDDVYAALKKQMPSGLTVLDQASAQDADVLVTTAENAKRIPGASLSGLKTAYPSGLKIAAPPEFGIRAYGIPGLKRVYGIDATLVPISDEGGQTTVNALTGGHVQVAKLTTTSPYLRGGKLVMLSDPKHLIAAQNVVPLASHRMAGDAKAVRVINAVQKKLTTSELIRMNAQSVNDKRPSDQIARDWLRANPIHVE